MRLISFIWFFTFSGYSVYMTTDGQEDLGRILPPGNRYKFINLVHTLHTKNHTSKVTRRVATQ